MKRALISVYFKDDIEKIGKMLADNGWEILSTGGTARFLEKNDIPVTEVSKITEFPEILDGRVKTLHPLVFGPILAKNTPEHLTQLNQYSQSPIDLVIVNFYPFEEALNDSSKGIDFMLENIDIGGPSMVRASAKNFLNTVVVVDFKDYLPVVEKLIQDGDLETEQRKQLSQKAFSYTSYYDSLIARYLMDRNNGLPDYINIAGRKAQELRYGENPHQKAALYLNDAKSPLKQMKQLHGKELSFNNILDMSMVYEVLNTFLHDPPFSVIVKHQNPCGAALGENLPEAFQKAFDGDPVSSFGGIVGFNTTVDEETALKMKKIFFEVIVAPGYTPEALALLQKKKNLRLIEVSLGYCEKMDFKTVPGGFVWQQRDNLLSEFSSFISKTDRNLKEGEKEDIIFGWKLIKYVKSNGIIIVKDRKLLGVGAGQMSRVDSVELAMKKSQSPLIGATLVSDAYFPFADSVELASQQRISVMVEPGGSIRDNEVIEAAKKAGITLLFTGIRHFRH